MHMKTSLAAAACGLLMIAGGADRAAADGLVDFQTMTPEVALELGQAALKSCRDGGYQVAVVVVDRFGQTQVALRDRFAGPHTIETARRKAWTAVSFRSDTLALADLTQPGSAMYGINLISEAMPLGGGVPVEAGGSIVGGVGVSGAPGPDIDDQCSRAGIDAVVDKLEF